MTCMRIGGKPNSCKEAIAIDIYTSEFVHDVCCGKVYTI